MTNRFAYAAAIGATLTGIYFAAVSIPRSDGPLHFKALAEIPVVEGGRVKPLDSVARSALVIISGRQTYKDTEGNEQPAIRWLMDVMAAGNPGEGPASKHQVFRIENDQVLKLLGLKARPGNYRYSLDELGEHFDDFRREVMRVMDLQRKDAKLDLFDQKIAELSGHIELYFQLVEKQRPLAVPPEAEGDEWRSLNDVLTDVNERIDEKYLAELKSKGLDPKKLNAEQIADLKSRMTKDLFDSRWRISPATGGWTEILAAYRSGLADGFGEQSANRFNQAVDDYRNYLGHVPESDVSRVRFERYFNEVQPFYKCLVLYVLVFVLAACSWIGWSEPLRGAAMGVTAVTLIFHFAALMARMFLMDRPFVFVTNLYSTAIFIGFGCVVLCFIVELMFPRGLGLAIAGISGSLSLIIAHFLALDTASGDTMQMLQAVLDTSFWLATHVTIINLGYAATFVAGLFGIAYIAIGMTSRGLAGPMNKSIAQIIYGVVCFGTLLSFVGTVLGGIWADQSWGRFWGWDPKENGALLIVIWNALILHARWAGMVKARGMAVLAVLGNIIVIWSWFATNELGIGLHAYGASSGQKRYWIDAAWLFHLVVGLVGASIPLRFWPSFSPAAQQAALEAAKQKRRQEPRLEPV